MNSLIEILGCFNNTKNNKELDELFDKIANKLTTLRKLVKIVSKTIAKKRTNNVVRGVEFTLDYVAAAN